MNGLQSMDDGSRDPSPCFLLGPLNKNKQNIPFRSLSGKGTYRRIPWLDVLVLSTLCFAYPDCCSRSGSGCWVNRLANPWQSPSTTPSWTHWSQCSSSTPSYCPLWWTNPGRYVARGPCSARNRSWWTICPPPFVHRRTGKHCIPSMHCAQAEVPNFDK